MNNKRELQKSDKGLGSLALYDIAFTVSNLDQAINWYRDVLNFKVITKTNFELFGSPASVAIMEGAGIKLELLHTESGKRIEEMFAPAPQHLIPIGNKAVVFQVENVKVASEELATKGVQFAWREQYMAGNVLSSMIEDMDGNKINIVQNDTIS